MSVTLPPELEALVRERLAEGRYASADEVLHQALLLLRERDAAHADRLRALRDEVRAGRDSLATGGAAPFDPQDIKLKARAARSWSHPTARSA